MTSLPKFFVLQATSGGPYLCPVENGSAANLLKFDESQIFSPRVKFAKKQSKTTGDETLVHIRSCFNNKYWVIHESQGEFWVAASSDKPEEDITNPRCTLFRVSTTTDATTNTSSGAGFLLQSIRSSSYACVFEGGALALQSQSQSQSESGRGDNFCVVDWEELVILPSQVTFKSEYLGGKYLANHKDDYYNKFESGLEVGNPLVAYELFPTSKGNYRIKSLFFGKFLRINHNWIWADADPEDNSSYTQFECIKISDNVIALRNLSNGLFCGGLTEGKTIGEIISSTFHHLGKVWRDGLTTKGITDCLNAKYPTMSRETRLIVEEPVMRRDISIKEYHLPASRIGKEEVEVLAEETIENRSHHKDVEQDIAFSKTTETITTWNNTISVKLGVSVTFETEAIPLIANGKVQLSAECGYQRQWGGTIKTDAKIETKTKVVVPPRTNMKVSFLCTKATCDVPFSYTQIDLLPNGKMVSTVKHDGNYKGVNAYEFKIRSTEVDEYGQELKLQKEVLASVNLTLIKPNKDKLGDKQLAVNK